MARFNLSPEEFAERAAEAAGLLKMLSHEARLMVLCRLVDGEVSAGALQRESGLTQSALSQHLAKLREEGLVQTRREAQTIYYSVADPRVVQILLTLAEIFCPPDAPRSRRR